MTPEQIKEKEDMVVSMCICKNCPTYKECGEKGGFCFFSIGKSRCITEEKGCICPTCPVTKQMGLKNTFYCTRGSEKEQMEIKLKGH